MTVSLNGLDPIDWELQQNAFQIMHAAKHLARERLGLPEDAQPKPNHEDRQIAFIVWRDWLTASGGKRPPLTPERRKLTAAELKFVRLRVPLL